MEHANLTQSPDWKTCRLESKTEQDLNTFLFLSRKHPWSYWINLKVANQFNLLFLIIFWDIAMRNYILT